MKLIVGLGNPGAQYTHTRHNVGFMVADQLAETLGATWKSESKLKAEIATAEIQGEKLVLAKPQTFMNLSGDAVQLIAHFYKIDSSQIWAVYDDVDVPFGRLRLRVGGSSGHQGVSSLFRTIGPDFVRARVGISLNDRDREPSEEYVLRPFNSEEREQLPRVVDSAATIIAKQLPANSLEETTFDLLQ